MARFRMFALVSVLALTAGCGTKAGTSPQTDPLQIDVANVDNSVDPPARTYSVHKGKDVQIQLYSTVAGVVHVQGYEKTATVQSGGEVVVEFVADKTGRFDVEMQRNHLKLLQLRVS